MIFLKKHPTDHGCILAMCDEELLGKVIKSGKLQIDLERYASFYKGELVREEKAGGMFSKDEIHSANIVGERSVNILIEKGIVEKGSVKKAGKVPFVHIYNVGVF